MIRIRARREDGGVVIRATGHAGMAPHGQDVICAGVSALLYGYLAYLEGLTPASAPSDTEAPDGALPHLHVVEADGFLFLQTRGLEGEDLRGWEPIAAGLRRIGAVYPFCLDVEDGVTARRTGIQHRNGGKEEHDA